MPAMSPGPPQRGQRHGAPRHPTEAQTRLRRVGRLGATIPHAIDGRGLLRFDDPRSLRTAGPEHRRRPESNPERKDGGQFPRPDGVDGHGGAPRRRGGRGRPGEPQGTAVEVDPPGPRRRGARPRVRRGRRRSGGGAEPVRGGRASVPAGRRLRGGNPGRARAVGELSPGGPDRGRDGAIAGTGLDGGGTTGPHRGGDARPGEARGHAPAGTGRDEVGAGDRGGCAGAQTGPLRRDHGDRGGRPVGCRVGGDRPLGLSADAEGLKAEGGGGGRGGGGGLGLGPFGLDVESMKAEGGGSEGRVLAIILGPGCVPAGTSDVERVFDDGIGSERARTDETVERNHSTTFSRCMVEQ